MDSTPSFFKILLDHTAPKLQLPPVFVKKLYLGGGFLENPLLLKINSGNKWRVKIENDGDAFYFSKGWLDFVRDTNTETGDFLAFSMINSSTFKVAVFGPNGCEKDSSFIIPKTCTICKQADEQEIDSDEENGLRSSTPTAPSMNPSFKKVIGKSHSHIMRFSMDFVKESGIRRGGQGRIMVRNKSGSGGLEVKICKFTDGRVCMGSGWFMFRTENNIMEGDTCIFTYVHGDQGGSGSSFIQVEVVKKAEE